jgi:hypothetical protein
VAKLQPSSQLADYVDEVGTDGTKAALPLLYALGESVGATASCIAPEAPEGKV